MTAREELSQSIAANLDRTFGKREFGPATQDYELADALLAEGWGKRRTVATVEELEALPVGSVVLSIGYRHYIDDCQLSFQRRSIGGWYRGGRSSDTHPDNFLPAMVLYEPQS